MRDKLEKLIAAYEELERKLLDPSVLADQKEYTRLAKEHAKHNAYSKADQKIFSITFAVKHGNQKRRYHKSGAEIDYKPQCV